MLLIESNNYSIKHILFNFLLLFYTMTRDEWLLFGAYTTATLAVISGVVYWATRYAPDGNPIPGNRTRGHTIPHEMNELVRRATRVCQKDRPGDFAQFFDYYRITSRKYTQGEIKYALEKVQWHNSPTTKLVNVPEYVVKSTLNTLSEFLFKGEYVEFFATLIALSIVYINCTYVAGYYQFEEVRAARFRQAKQALRNETAKHLYGVDYDPSKDLRRQRLATEVWVIKKKAWPISQARDTLLSEDNRQLRVYLRHHRQWTAEWVTYFKEHPQKPFSEPRNFPKDPLDDPIVEEEELYNDED